MLYYIVFSFNVLARHYNFIFWQSTTIFVVVSHNVQPCVCLRAGFDMHSCQEAYVIIICWLASVWLIKCDHYLLGGWLKSNGNNWKLFLNWRYYLKGYQGITLKVTKDYVFEFGHWKVFEILSVRNRKMSESVQLGQLFCLVWSGVWLARIWCIGCGQQAKAWVGWAMGVPLAEAWRIYPHIWGHENMRTWVIWGYEDMRIWGR